MAKNLVTFQHANAHTLSLWKTSLPNEAGLDEILSKFNIDAPQLSAADRLCDVFPAPPVDGFLHLVVRAPSLGEYEPQS